MSLERELVILALIKTKGRGEIPLWGVNSICRGVKVKWIRKIVLLNVVWYSVVIEF